MLMEGRRNSCVETECSQLHQWSQPTAPAPALFCRFAAALSAGLHEIEHGPTRPHLLHGPGSCVPVLTGYHQGRGFCMSSWRGCRDSLTGDCSLPPEEKTRGEKTRGEDRMGGLINQHVINQMNHSRSGAMKITFSSLMGLLKKVCIRENLTKTLLLEKFEKISCCMSTETRWHSVESKSLPALCSC